VIATRLSRPLFDAYLVADWSGANRPRTGRDSIWVCQWERHGDGLCRSLLQNPATRHAARDLLRRALADLVARGRRALVGFDFAFGYPAGFARGLGLRGPAWRAAWDEIARLVRDDADNGNNRFRVAAELNRRLTGGAAPFWGCPPRAASRFLAARKSVRPRPDGPEERRLADLCAAAAQPVWKLAYPGAVGSQTLLGIPVVRALRDEFAGASRVWPFETGLAPPADPECRVVYAEVYPSLLDPRVPPGRIKDAVQVTALGRHFARLDGAGELSALFAAAGRLPTRARRRAETEEGWILGARPPA
jgi:hypothetical protein